MVHIIPEKFKIFRIDAGLSVPNLAKKAKVAKGTIYDFEKDGKVGEEILKACCDVIGIKPSDILVLDEQYDVESKAAKIKKGEIPSVKSDQSRKKGEKSG